jgi:hypothetical protein
MTVPHHQVFLTNPNDLQIAQGIYEWKRLVEAMYKKGNKTNTQK